MFSYNLVKVISETLRLGNVVRFLHRKALKDVRYKGKINLVVLDSSHLRHITILISLINSI